MGDTQDRAEMSGWISVNLGIPSDGREVLIVTRSKNGNWNIDKGYYMPAEIPGGGRWVHRGVAEVTHWMDLPALPEDWQ